MKVGLFFGTFDPIHNGHISICQNILNSTDINEIWLVISPKSPNKVHLNILDKDLRYKLIYNTLKNQQKIKPSNIEFDMEEPNFSHKTLSLLVDKFPNNKFIIIMGEDNFLSLDRWEKSNYIKSIEIIVYPRRKKMIKNYFDGKIINISSKNIRKRVKLGKTISHMVPKFVENEIKLNKFYLK